MDRIQDKEHRRDTYKIKKILLPCSDEKMYKKMNKVDQFLVIKVNFKKQSSI